MYLTLPFVVYELECYLWLAHEKRVGADPNSMSQRDWHILLSVLLWMAAHTLILCLA